jgi:two-component system response regulator AtoC
MKKVLIIEKQAQMASVLQPVLEAAGLAVVVINPDEGLMDQIRRAAIAVVLVNLEGLKKEGLTVLAAIRAFAPKLAVITLNASPNVELSIQAMRMGVFDDLLMPLNVESLIASIRRAMAITDPNNAEPAAGPATISRTQGDPS